MFAYNPAVTDRSGEILANAMSNASALQLEGMQSLGNAFANLGNSYADSISKAKENAAKAETNLGTSEAIASIYQTFGSPKQYQDYMAGLDRNAKNQDKLSGYNAIHVQTANALIDIHRQQQQYAGALELARQKQALGIGSGSDTGSSTSTNRPSVNLLYRQ